MKSKSKHQIQFQYQITSWISLFFFTIICGTPSIAPMISRVCFAVSSFCFRICKAVFNRLHFLVTFNRFKLRACLFSLTRPLFDRLISCWDRWRPVLNRLFCCFKAPGRWTTFPSPVGDISFFVLSKNTTNEVRSIDNQMMKNSYSYSLVHFRIYFRFVKSFLRNTKKNTSLFYWNENEKINLIILFM